MRLLLLFSCLLSLHYCLVHKSRDFNQTQYDDSHQMHTRNSSENSNKRTLKTSQNKKKSSNTAGNYNNKISFVPWPHRRIFDGLLEDGVWLFGDISTAESKLNQNINSLDNIQLAAITDGLFYPTKRNFPKFHVFSTSEALECLQGKTIYLTGDSYMVQMFIGLSDVLLGRHSNTEIMTGKQRDELFTESAGLLKKNLPANTIISFLYYNCHLQDFTCTNGQMMDDNTWRKADALIASIAIHYKGLHLYDPLLVDHYAIEAAQFFKSGKEKKLTWVTGLSYRKSLNQSVVQMNFRAMEEAKKLNVPLIDVFTLTETCSERNCSTDGGHKSRYVNRMKVQMLLNNLCNI